VQAGNDIRDYRRRYPELGIMCGLDKRCLAETPESVDREIQRCTEMVRVGRYVPGFDHLIPPDSKGELVRRAAEGIKRVRYGYAH